MAARRRAVDGRERPPLREDAWSSPKKSEEKSYMQSADSLGQDDLAN